MDITALLTDLVKFVQLSQASYDALSAKDEKSLYFVANGTSTKLYKGNTLVYNSPVIYTASTLDAGLTAGTTVLPFNEVIIVQGTSTLALAKSSADGKSYTILMGMNKTVGSTDNYAPTEKAVRTYVTSQINSLKSEVQAGTVTAVSYNKTTKQLSVTAGGTTTTTPIDGVASAMAYNSGRLTITDVSGTTLSTVNLELERFLSDAYYDAATKSLVFEIETEGSTTPTKISIPAEEFVTLYTGKASSTATTTISAVSGGSSTVEVDVKVSAVANNSLTAKTDGLHVDISNKIDKVTATNNGVLLANGSGSFKSSAKTIDTAFDTNSTSGANKIPTSYQTANWVTNNAVMNSQKTTSVRTDGSAVDTTVPTEKAVATAINTTVEDAIVAALSWKVIS